jgi:hypothetical protein
VGFKTMRKIILASVMALSVGGLIIAYNVDTSKANSAETTYVVKNSESNSPAKIVIAHGKTDGFNSLSELENGTPIIVRGIKTGKLKTQIYRSEVNNKVMSVD